MIEIPNSAYCKILPNNSLVESLVIIPGNSFRLIFDANFSPVEAKPHFFQTDEEVFNYYNDPVNKIFYNDKSWQRIETSDNETNLGIVMPFYGVFLILYVVRKGDSVAIGADLKPYKDEAFERLDLFFLEEISSEESLSRIFRENMLGEGIIHVAPGIVIKKERLYTCTRITEGLPKDSKIREIWIASIPGKGPVKSLNMQTIDLGIQRLSGNNSWQDVVINPGKHTL